MSLTKQVHLYSVCTDGFYDEQEQYYHKRLLKLYGLRKESEKVKIRLTKGRKCKKELSNFEKEKGSKWRRASINRVILKEKEKLSELLDNKLQDDAPRILNENSLANKNVVSLFESSLTRALGLKTNDLTTDIFIVNVFFFQVFENLVENGFLFRGEKYIFLTASAGQIRTKKAVFIKESAYEKIKMRLMCGLTVEDINNAGGINPNKFMSYSALNNSATDVWEDFDIDKAIVVDDFETLVNGEVDYIDYQTYEITRKRMDVPINQMDGAGIMLDGPTRMVRLSWIKGLLVYFPYDKFIKEKCPNGDCIVTDIYGQKHKIIEEDIRYIFTKSQFKLYKYYDSWEQYKDNFKKYNCEACYCNIEEDFIPSSRINYQMLQTLSDITDKEIDILSKRSVKEIQEIGNDYQTTMRLLGATEYNTNPSYFQQALMIYPELFRDSYCKDILKQTKKSLVKQAKAGRLRVNGKYTFVISDLYAFCEWLFLGIENPKGLLKDGEVYCNMFRNNDELACLRSPHLYREWPIRKNVRNEETDKWFGDTKCIYASCFDTISKILMYDSDGDKLLVIKDKLLTSIAKRNMQDIVPLYYEMKKAQGGFLTRQSLYDGMTAAYTGGNIGIISNQISKVWGSKKEISQDELNVVKWLVMENNFVIDKFILN